MHRSSEKRRPMKKEYYDYLVERCPQAKEILEDPQYLALEKIPRHFYSNTLEHSVHVALLMGWLAERHHGDVASCIKVGLLHDMCFVNYREENDNPGLYCFYHPEEAIENGDASYGLNEHETLSIRCHMWPLAFHMPASRMAVALTLTDKVTAVYEVLYGMKRVSRTVRRFAERVMPEFR